MRIIAGTRRGQKLKEFSGFDVRPTTDRVRESMFNLICDFIMGASVLDLFGGSGALSFESISRGAKKSIICDNDKKSIELILKNKEWLKFGDEITVLNKSAQDFLKGNKDSFDIIFLDPPYNKGFISPIIEEIIKTKALAEDGIIVLESDNTDEHGEFFGLSVLKKRKYGRTFVTIYKRG